MVLIHKWRRSFPPLSNFLDGLEFAIPRHFNSTVLLVALTETSLPNVPVNRHSWCRVPNIYISCSSEQNGNFEGTLKLKWLTGHREGRWPSTILLAYGAVWSNTSRTWRRNGNLSVRTRISENKFVPNMFSVNSLDQIPLHNWYKVLSTFNTVYCFQKQVSNKCFYVTF